MKTKQKIYTLTLPSSLSQLRSTLLPWYQQHKRSLPWRQTKDPYKIWLSEIMLQQTQVTTVIDYYQRFLKKFPTLESLAKAKEQDVLTLWSGLGYYSRAKNLQKAAQKIVQNYHGIFPNDPAEMLKLPGIGLYTRGAIASIAFDLPVALVDGNVIRVYSRLLALAGSPSDAKFVKEIWRVAEGVIEKLDVRRETKEVKSKTEKNPGLSSHLSRLTSSPPHSPGDFNQALMELGATICSPKNPSCLICPLQKCCEGKLLGPENFPEKKKRTKTKEMTRVVWVMLEHEKGCRCILPHPDPFLKKEAESPLPRGERAGVRVINQLDPHCKIQLIQDPNTRWHKGLWQLPGEWEEGRGKRKEGRGEKGEGRRETKDVKSEMGKSSHLPSHLLRLTPHVLPLPSFTHHITHHKIKVLPYLVRKLEVSRETKDVRRKTKEVRRETGKTFPLPSHISHLTSHASPLTSLPLPQALKLPLPAPDKKILNFLREFMDKGRASK
ncbi:MAG: hypothetical protein HQM15_00310 [Deltaproteobacteria bacterium]|nr:hypothetical protein [Deltaproteobacteria bacterium]